MPSQPPSCWTRPSATTCSHLARAADPGPRRRPRRSRRLPAVRPSLQYTLDAIVGGPAMVRNGRMDLIATNLLGRALYLDAYASQTHPVNIARYAFLPRKETEVLPRLGPRCRPDRRHP